MQAVSAAHARQQRIHRIVLAAWVLILSGVSLLVSGYRDVYGANHGFQLLLVQKINNPALYPADPVAEVIFSFASAFWYGVAWLTRGLNLSAVLFVLFWVKNILLLLMGYRWARLLFPHSWGAVYAAPLFLATAPAPLIGNGHPSDSLEQTSFSVIVALLALESLLRRREGAYMLWMGLVTYFNPMYAIFAYSYVALSVFGDRVLRRDWLRWAGATVGSLGIGLPGWLLLLRAARPPVADPQAVWQTAELSYPYHFFPKAWDIEPQLVLLAYGALVLALCRFWGGSAGRLRLHLALWTTLALGYYLLAWLTPYVLCSLTLLQLHPIRATELWFVVAGIFLAAGACAWVESRPAETLRRWFTPLALLVCTGATWRFGYGAGFSIKSMFLLTVGLEAYRQMAQRTAWRLTVGVILVLCGAFVAANALRIHMMRVSRYGNWMGIPRAPAYEIARWARASTPADTVFLVPLYSDAEGWHHFRHLSQRGVFVTRKDGTAWPFAPHYAHEWKARMRAAGLFEVAQLDDATYRIGAWVHIGILRRGQDYFRRANDRLDDMRVRQIAKRYRIDYWIVPVNKPTRFPEVHTHGEWKVVRVMP